jgi:hypothetical protein
MENTASALDLRVPFEKTKRNIQLRAPLNGNFEQPIETVMTGFQGRVLFYKYLDHFT